MNRRTARLGENVVGKPLFLIPVFVILLAALPALVSAQLPTNCSDGQVLKSIGGSWVCANDDSGTVARDNIFPETTEVVRLGANSGCTKKGKQCLGTWDVPPGVVRMTVEVHGAGGGAGSTGSPGADGGTSIFWTATPTAVSNRVRGYGGQGGGKTLTTSVTGNPGTADGGDTNNTNQGATGGTANSGFLGGGAGGLAVKAVENPSGPFEYRVGYGGKASSRSGAAGSHGFIKITLSRGSFTCNGVNKVLQWNGTAWQCVTFNIIPVPPTCTGDNSALQWSGSAWSCQAIATPTPETAPVCPPTGKTNPVTEAVLIRDASGWGCQYEEYKDVGSVAGTYTMALSHHSERQKRYIDPGRPYYISVYTGTSCQLAAKIYNRSYTGSVRLGNAGRSSYTISQCRPADSSSARGNYSFQGQNTLEQGMFNTVTINGAGGTLNYTGKAWVPIIDR